MPTTGIWRKRRKGMQSSNIVALTPNPQWTRSQRRLLEVLEQEENQRKSVIGICKLAGMQKPLMEDPGTEP